jgi:hypothetical protein
LVLGLDLSMPLRKGIGASAEWRYSKSGALSLQYSWEEHAKASEFGLFNGDLVANFAEVQIDTLYKGNYPMHIIHTEYVGDGRPLPVLPEQVALATSNIKFGHKFFFERKKSKWGWSLLPSLSLTGHRYFDVHQRFAILEEYTQITQLGYSPTKELIKKFRLYHEKQTMREQVKWVFGIGYDMGVTRKIGRRWALDFRVSGLFNFEQVHESPIPSPARTLQARAHLWLMYSIGKIR